LQERSSQGSFVLSAMLGNTGFIGLAIAKRCCKQIAPLLISEQALSLVVFYSISQNLVGTCGIWCEMSYLCLLYRHLASAL